jgi:hypothetical protein
VGGKPQLHAVGSDHERNVSMDLGERVDHTLVVGITRSELRSTQDIYRAGPYQHGQVIPNCSLPDAVCLNDEF